MNTGMHHIYFNEKIPVDRCISVSAVFFSRTYIKRTKVVVLNNKSNLNQIADANSSKHKKQSGLNWHYQFSTASNVLPRCTWTWQNDISLQNHTNNILHVISLNWHHYESYRPNIIQQILMCVSINSLRPSEAYICVCNLTTIWPNAGTL